MPSGMPFFFHIDFCLEGHALAKTQKRPQMQTTLSASESTTIYIGSRITAVLGIFLLIVSFMRLGIVGAFLFKCLQFIFGSIMLYPFFALLAYCSIYTLIKGHRPKHRSPLWVGLILISIAVMIIACYQGDLKGLKLIPDFVMKPDPTKGIIGVVLYAFLSTLFAPLGALIAASILLVAGSFLVLSRIYVHMQKESLKEEKPHVEKIKRPLLDPEKKKKVIDFFFEDTPDTPQEEPEVSEPVQSALEYDPETMRLEIREKEEKKPENPKKKNENEKAIKISTKPVTTQFGTYQLPSLKLLDIPRNARGNQDEMRIAKLKAAKLEELFAQFGVNVHVQDVHIGPTVTKYELKLEVGTRVNKILSLQDDIQLTLATKDVRIEAPIPGKPYVGVEVPNSSAALVSYYEVFSLSQKDPTFQNKMAVPLGKDVSGQLVVAELDQMPHLLVAGATGSGKSVCINVIITSILMKATPDEVRMILIDPKKVELSNYNGIPHLLAPVVTDPKKAAGVLQEVVAEMERRYEVFAASNVRNMKTYNAYAKDYNLDHPAEPKEVMPYMLVILDEVADLMMVASKTVEDCIMRISQMARAAGIHMIVATQRPSTDIITGVIKANIPSRIAFSVSSGVDSRTILDATGAEKLLGHGDMLFAPMGVSSPIRVQGAFLNDKEVERIVDFVSNQVDTDYEKKYVEAKDVTNSSPSDSGLEDLDEEYEECRSFVIQAQKASTSLLQRKFRIGYNKAARIIEQLEENGVIGPQIGSKPREVYIKPSTHEDEA